jgi:hypothetical protein
MELFKWLSLGKEKGRPLFLGQKRVQIGINYFWKALSYAIRVTHSSFLSAFGNHKYSVKFFFFKTHRRSRLVVKAENMRGNFLPSTKKQQCCFPFWGESKLLRFIKFIQLNHSRFCFTINWMAHCLALIMFKYNEARRFCVK